MTREEIIAAILAERKAQELLHPVPDGHHSPADWVAIITHHLGMAICDEAHSAGDARFLIQMVRVAATAVAAVENMPKESKEAGLQSKGNPW